MPFTPYHMGPGLAAKALLGPRMSLLVFGLTQVAIDIEPLVRLVNGDARLHGHSHTYLGAALIASACFLVGVPLFRWLVGRWNASEPDPSAHISERVTATSAAIGALLGGASHIALDSIMHHDMQPYWPLSDTNGLLGVIPVEALHKLCVLCGVFGLALVVFRHYWFYVRNFAASSRDP